MLRVNAVKIQDTQFLIVFKSCVLTEAMSAETHHFLLVKVNADFTDDHIEHMFLGIKSTAQRRFLIHPEHLNSCW